MEVLTEEMVKKKRNEQLFVILTLTGKTWAMVWI
jgi:hypothetical protein